MELKPGYKMTEVGVIPEDWSVRSLGDIATIKDGTHQTPKYQASGVPFYSVEHVTSGDFENTRFISEQEHQFLTRYFRIEKGDILMTRIGSIGECKLIDWDVRASFYVSLALLKIKGASAEYIAQYSNSSTFNREIELNSLQHATPKKINLGPISEVKIVLPQTEVEQRAIAQVLSDVDALLAALDRLIAKKQAIKQATMQPLLTGKKRLPGFSGAWEVKRLGEVAEIVMGQSPSSSNYNSIGNGIPLIQGNADIANRWTIKRTYTTQITKLGKAGDILMSVRAPVGEVSRTMFDVCLGRGVCAIRFPNEFLYHTLVFLESSWAKHSKGSTFDSVNSNDVKAVEIRLPIEEAEQTAIAAVLSDMDAELSALKTRRDKTRQLKHAMMQELLTGKTRLLTQEHNHA